jgi:DNA-binding IclR family transcriptional regulator
MSVQSARENAVLDALVRRTGTVGELMSALDGNGMLASPHGVSEILAALVRRGLVTRSGSAYRLTASGLDAVRRRKAARSTPPVLARPPRRPSPWSPSW